MAQLWRIDLWIALQESESKLTSSTKGRWWSWGSLINSPRDFISCLMDLVSAYQCIDYLLQAVCWGYILVFVCVWKCTVVWPSMGVKMFVFLHLHRHRHVLCQENKKTWAKLPQRPQTEELKANNLRWNCFFNLSLLQVWPHPIAQKKGSVACVCWDFPSETR